MPKACKHDASYPSNVIKTTGEKSRLFCGMMAIAVRREASFLFQYEGDDAVEPVVFERRPDEAGKQQNHQDEHDAVRESLGVGAAEIGRFSNVGHKPSS